MSLRTYMEEPVVLNRWKILSGLVVVVLIGTGVSKMIADNSSEGARAAAVKQTTSISVETSERVERITGRIENSILPRIEGMVERMEAGRVEQHNEQHLHIPETPESIRLRSIERRVHQQNLELEAYLDARLPDDAGCR